MLNDKANIAIGSVWHSTDRGKTIVSMHDAQWLVLMAHIATLTEQHRLVSEECRAWRTGWADDCSDSWDSPLGVARAAVDAANALAKGE